MDGFLLSYTQDLTNCGLQDSPVHIFQIKNGLYILMPEKHDKEYFMTHENE